MNFFTKIWDSIKEALMGLGAVLIAFIGYKLVSQERKLKTLEQEKLQAEAQNAIQEQQGEINAAKQQVAETTTTLEKATDNLRTNESELDKLRRERPK